MPDAPRCRNGRLADLCLPRSNEQANARDWGQSWQSPIGGRAPLAALRLYRYDLRLNESVRGNRNGKPNGLATVAGIADS